MSKHDALLEKDRQQLRQLEAQLETLHADMLEYSEEYEKCEGYGEVLKERHRNLENSRNQLEEALAQLRERQRPAARRGRGDSGQSFCSGGGADRSAQPDAERGEPSGRRCGGSLAEAGESLKGELLDVLSTMAQLRNEIRYSEQQREALQTPRGTTGRRGGQVAGAIPPLARPAREPEQGSSRRQLKA